MPPALKWMSVAALVAGSFAWGTAVGFYRVFPYDQVRQIKNLVEGDPGPPPRQMFVNPRTFVNADVDLISSATADVVMVGDSITNLGRWNEYFPNTRIINRGVGGDTISGVLRRSPEILARRPRQIFLYIGVNDVVSGNTNEEILPVYDAVIRRLGSQGATVYVQSIACGERCSDEQMAQLAELNAALATLARQRGAQFVDLARALGGPWRMNPTYTHDGLHFTGEGYRRWIETIRPHVEGQH